MSVITNKWNDGSGDSINIESPSFQGNQTVKISSPVQKGTSKRSMRFIGKCKKDSSKQVILTVEQEASTYTYDLTLNSDNTEIAAKGGTANITAVLKTYRNGNLVSTDNVTPVLSGSATGFSISGTKVTASNRTTTVGSRRSIVVTGKYSNTFDGQTVSSTITIYQAANEVSYGTLTGGSVLASDIPASGGTSSTSISNMSQTISYTSGSTRAGTVTHSRTSEITVSSLGITVKARTKVGQVTVTYTGEGSVTVNKTIDIYQAENKVINSNYNPRITVYGTPTISIGSGLTAAGGSASVSASVTNTETYNALYSSGATGPNKIQSVDGSLSISMTVNGNSRFSLSGNTITHSSMGTNETTDTITIKAVNDGDNSKSATASKSIVNSKTVKSTSGGIYTYGNITAGTITNATIPASGGSATAKAGNGSQTWNKSATVTTYQYTSGATKDVTEAASSGTNSVAPSIASITATASSKGTTVSAQTTVKSQAVTWSANGKSASGTMYIYQAANSIDSYNYGNWNIVISANPIFIAASGGTSTITANCTRTKTPVYTSGSTGTATSESATPTLALTTNSGGFTLSGNKLTAANNPIGAKTATVTASYSGATSKSVTITQSAGPEEVSVTIKAYEIYDDNKLYLTADIKEISSTGDTVGTTRPDEPLVITRNKDSVITYYALPLSFDWYNIGSEEVVFDTDKTVEILCLRKNNGLIKVRTRDALTGCMISGTIYDETGKKIGNCGSSENGYVSEANPIGFERNYKTLGDNRYEATEPIMFIAAKPSEAVVNYIDLHPKEGQDYIALKFIDSVTKAPITTGISCWFSSSVKTIVTDYQGIAHISGTYDSKVVILVRRDGYVKYNQSYDNLANHSVTTIELVPEPVFENDDIDYMQIQGDGVDHYIFQIGRTPNTRSNDVQILSEEPVEVATETKSESLFAKIKRIITNLN